jgi:hypothetical protein
VTEFDDLPTLDLSLDALTVFDTTFELGLPNPTAKTTIKPNHHATTIFVKIRNPAQFEKAKAVIGAALHQANIDHHL